MELSPWPTATWGHEPCSQVCAIATGPIRGRSDSRALRTWVPMRYEFSVSATRTTQSAPDCFLLSRLSGSGFHSHLYPRAWTLIPTFSPSSQVNGRQPYPMFLTTIEETQLWSRFLLLYPLSLSGETSAALGISLGFHYSVCLTVHGPEPP